VYSPDLQLARKLSGFQLFSNEYQQSFTSKYVKAKKCNFLSTVRDIVNCRYTSV